MDSVEQLVSEGASLLKDYLTDPRTSLLRRLAPIVVDLRSRYTLEDGRADWGGRSPEYRAAMAEMYARAEVPKEKLDTVQAAMRYHIGNLLRERATNDELISVGLTTTAPRERNAANRGALAALAEAAGGRTPRHELDRLAVYAQAILEFLDESAIPRLSPERALVARMALEKVQARATEVLAILTAQTERKPRRQRRGGGGGGTSSGREASLRSV